MWSNTSPMGTAAAGSSPPKACPTPSDFLLQKACADGLIPWDVGWDKLSATLNEDRTYRDSAFSYTIIELEGPAAFNN